MRQVTSVSYGLEDGMRSLECSSGTEPSAWKAHDGKLWYATSGGVSVIDPHRIPKNNLIPPVRIEELVVDGVTLPAGNTNDGIVLRPGTKNLEFQYTALSFRVPERVKFRYKIEGYDQEWVEAETRRVAYYTNLSPRKYRFRVIAGNDDGVWNEAGAALTFDLKPFFYQTRSFYALCLLAAVVAGFGAQRLRVKRLKKLVETRTHELSKANQKLLEAQERITKLLEVQPQALENISGWSQSVAKDIAQVVGAGGISIWIREGEGFRSWGESDTGPPSLDQVKNAPMDIASSGLVPVTGSTGQILGALTIVGGKVVWGETERRLISGLANQLGSALEMQRMRQDLASTHQKRAATIQQLHDQGIATVQLCPHCNRCYDHSITNCPSDGIELQIPQILPFKILDRYRLARLLGQGGIGTVYQAQDEKLKRFVAVKILRKEFLDDPYMKDRWEREAHMVARLHHPGIVELYDVGELADGSAFFVMELLEGVDLSRILKAQGPASPSQVADVLQQVGSALGSAHTAGVIHRDLKPANLFLIPGHDRFQLKVVDFGIAKLIREEASITRTGVLLGSPSYMSPEQIRGQKLDQRSDLFSLASVTYELLTGNVAFSAESVPEVFMHVLVDQPVPIPDMELNKIIFSALEKNPDSRPHTVASWVNKIVPLLQKSESVEYGWRLSMLQTEFAAPATGDVPTEQL
jgi:tRNA A-37 threonylcarbamoyl transferase component Bud32